MGLLGHISREEGAYDPSNDPLTKLRAEVARLKDRLQLRYQEWSKGQDDIAVLQDGLEEQRAANIALKERIVKLQEERDRLYQLGDTLSLSHPLSSQKSLWNSDPIVHRIYLEKGGK